MGFRTSREWAEESELAGKEWFSYIHKSGSIILPSAGMAGDLSMAAGIPKYNAYVGTQNEATPMYGSGNFGIYTGPDPAVGETKHIADIALNTTSATLAPASFYLCDYLMHYPLTDMDNTDEQFMDNTATLPRYVSGNGVRLMIVTTTPQTAVAQVNIKYTNSQNVPNRIATIWTTPHNTGGIQAGNASSGAANTQAVFVPLQDNDTGIRSIQSVTCLASAGGFCALVLVRPIADIKIREQNTVAEINYLTHKLSLPKVEQGACLNFAYTSGVAAISSLIRGYIKFTWS